MSFVEVLGMVRKHEIVQHPGQDNRVLRCTSGGFSTPAGFGMAALVGEDQFRCEGTQKDGADGACFLGVAQRSKGPLDRLNHLRVDNAVGLVGPDVRLVEERSGTGHRVDHAHGFCQLDGLENRRLCGTDLVSTVQCIGLRNERIDA